MSKRKLRTKAQMYALENDRRFSHTVKGNDATGIKRDWHLALALNAGQRSKVWL